MIQIRVKANGATRIVNKEINATPAEVFSDLDLEISKAQITVNGTILTASQINSTFEALGVEDGSEVRIGSVVKTDNAIR